MLTRLSPLSRRRRSRPTKAFPSPSSAAVFTGLSTALHLAEQGVDVLALEAQEPGWGASGNNGGQINPGLSPTQIRSRAILVPS